MEEATVGVAAEAFRLPPRYVKVSRLREECEGEITRLRERLQLPKLKGLTLEEVDGVHGFDGEPEGELALEAIREALDARGVRGRDVSLILDYSTVSRDANGLSLCYRVQQELGADEALTLAIGNGSCVALHLALKTAAAFFRGDGGMRHAVLFSEDRVEGRRLNFPFHALGDGSSAVLLERNAGRLAVLDTEYLSMGRLRKILGIRHRDESNFDACEFEDKIVPLHYKVTRELVTRLLRRRGLGMGDVALFLYQNMSFNDQRGLASALGVPAGRVYSGGLKGRGHIFGADLVINLCLAQAERKFEPGEHVMLVSSGAGFSWGATLLRV